MKSFVGLCMFSLCCVAHGGQAAPAVYVAPNTVSTSDIGGPVVVSEVITTQQLQQTVETSNAAGYVLGQAQQQTCTNCVAPSSMAAPSDPPAIGGGGRIKKLLALLRFRNRGNDRDRVREFNISRSIRSNRN